MWIYCLVHCLLWNINHGFILCPLIQVILSSKYQNRLLLKDSVARNFYVRVTTAHHSCLCLWPTEQCMLEADTTAGALILTMDWVFLFLTTCYLIRKPPTISLFTASPPSETSIFSFLTGSNHRKKSSWICSLFYFIPISPSLYKTAWKKLFLCSPLPISLLHSLLDPAWPSDILARLSR